TVMGFGLIRPHIQPDKLQKMISPVVSVNRCQRVGFLVNQRTEFCAGYFNTSMATQEGDSGDPFVFYTNNGPLLLGIDSRGSAERRGYNHDSWPEIYEKISYFYPWIRSMLCMHGGPC
ncbi:MAG: trypsin-like serine protease, partial [Enterobacteriaceae bacterium]